LGKDQLVDLRSDTVTKPSPGMLEAMMAAEVGDDVLGDDPTVLRLQDRVAALLGKEAALFVPSGTMGNQLAIRAQLEHGDEIICHEDSHIYHYEGGAPAALSGCSLGLLRGARGFFTAADVSAAIRPVECHFAQSGLVLVENTHNRGGGSVWPLEAIAAIESTARQHGLKMHLDGARLMNATVASGLDAADYAKHFDTVSICFSKGLGAPVGSALAGRKEVIARAHRFRKMFGGAMRQSGLLAAAAIYALDHNVEAIAHDHDNARRLAAALVDMPGISLDASTVETNIIYLDVDPASGNAPELAERLKAAGVWMLALGPQRLRAVTHLDVSASDIDVAIQAFGKVLGDGG
jgi:threonine aldolase